ncbi:MAG: hypothetical protein KatS3mg098_418 [Candidatus Parcubacteria bacterium]|nr:MAG: hypothetical protein KatS3mg098_418 [Candidatus Parcubacteria bacterium]
MLRLFLFILFLLLSLAGAIDSIYIFKKRKKLAGKPFVCPLNYDCRAVLESSWAKISGVSNEILGIVFYFLVGATSLAWYLVGNNFPLLGWLLMALLVSGALFSLFLVGVQSFIIKNFCFYCLVSALISIFLAILSIFLVVPSLGSFFSIFSYLLWLSVWLPKIFFFFLTALLIFFFFKSRKKPESFSFKKALKKLVTGALVFYILFALFLTAIQYYLWSRFDFTRPFLKTPVFLFTQKENFLSKLIGKEGKLNYFLFYSWGRFWLKVFIVFLVSFLWLFFLHSLEKSNPRFFEEGDKEIGLLGALICGWPQFIVFLIFSFLLVIIFSLFRSFFLKEKYTLLREPFILATLITFFGNSFWIKFFGLGVILV